MTTIQNVLETIADLVVELQEAEWDWNYHTHELRGASSAFDEEYHEREADIAWDRKFEAQKALRKHGVNLNDAERRRLDKRKAERKANK